MRSCARFVRAWMQQKRRTVQSNIPGLYCTSATRPKVKRSQSLMGMAAANHDQRRTGAASTLLRLLQADDGGHKRLRRMMAVFGGFAISYAAGSSTIISETLLPHTLEVLKIKNDPSKG
jgi:hypothetical protein